MAQRRRKTDQQTQEGISRSEVQTIFRRQGWEYDPVGTDLGEDDLTRVYDSAVWSGLSCFTQVKSVRDASNITQADGSWSLSLEVKDLEHWEVSSVPVILVVWDMKDSVARWCFADELIAELQERRPNWRTQKTTSVRLPATQMLDDLGFTEVRRYLAKYYLPSMAATKSQELKVLCEYPDTPEGREEASKFERFIKAGDPVTLSGPFLTSVTMSPWQQRMYELPDFNPAKGVLILGPAASSESHPARIAVRTNDDAAVVPHVDLRVEKSGTEEITLSNAHQKIPLQVRVILNSESRRSSLNRTFDNREPAAHGQGGLSRGSMMAHPAV